MTKEFQSIPIEGHQLTIEQPEGGGAILRLSDASGHTPLTIEIGPQGPVLRIGTGLAIAVEGALSFDAQRVDVHAREGFGLRCGGDVVVQSEGDFLSSAREHVLESQLGDVRLDANDDIKLRGERIRLNC